MATAKQQQAFYKQHLQELTIFKAKSSAALLQVVEWSSLFTASCTNWCPTVFVNRSVVAEYPS